MAFGKQISAQCTTRHHKRCFGVAHHDKVKQQCRCRCHGLKDDFEVPTGMFEAVVRSCPVSGAQASQVLTVALNWLTKNPIVTTPEEIGLMEIEIRERTGMAPSSTRMIAEWQRRMFRKGTTE